MTSLSSSPSTMRTPAWLASGTIRRICSSSASISPGVPWLKPRFFDDAQAGADRALGVVLVRFIGAERREHAVAGVLQNAAAIRPHDGGEALERAVHQRLDLLGLQLLPDGGRFDHVDEQH